MVLFFYFEGFILQVVSHLNQPTTPSTAAATIDNTSTIEGIATAPTPTATSNEATTSTYDQRMTNLKRILEDGLDIDLTLNFLFKNSHTDLNILKDIKTAIEGRSNVLHNAAVIAHAYMNSG